MLRQHGKIIAILCLISSLGRFVLDSYLPSLPAIRNQFNISSVEVQFTLTIYLLGFSFSQLVYGPLSDRYGRRIVILSGMLIFLAGSFIGTLATTAAKIMLSRLVTGIGAGACGVLNRAIASDCFKGRDFSRAWSYTTTTLVLTLILAPILGGILQDSFGWRANFILATLLIGAVMLVIARFLPETHKHISTSSLSVRHILSNYSQALMSRSFLAGTICYTLAFSGLIIYFQVSPLLYINFYGLSPTQYGWSSIVIAMSYLAGGLLVNWLASRMSIRALLFLGITLLISGGMCMLLACELGALHLAAILLPSAIYVTGARIVIPNAIAASMEESRHAAGMSSALIGCLQMLGSSFISLLIAHCSAATPVPLGVFMTLLGASSLLVLRYIAPPRFAKNVK